MNVKDILNITDGELICGDESKECINFSKDSRQINDGDVYIAIRGENFDGNDFYLDAIKSGAKICILSKTVESIKDVTIIKVKDTLIALQQIASYKRNQYKSEY